MLPWSALSGRRVSLKWHSVECVHTSRHLDSGYLLPYPRHHRLDQARPVLVVPSIAAWPSSCGQHLIQEIPVTLLDVNEIKSSPMRQFRRPHIIILESRDVIVGYDRVIGADSVFLGNRIFKRCPIKTRIALGQERPAVRVPP